MGAKECRNWGQRTACVERLKQAKSHVHMPPLRRTNNRRRMKPYLYVENLYEITHLPPSNNPHFEGRAGPPCRLHLPKVSRGLRLFQPKRGIERVSDKKNERSITWVHRQDQAHEHR